MTCDYLALASFGFGTYVPNLFFLLVRSICVYLEVRIESLACLEYACCMLVTFCINTSSYETHNIVFEVALAALEWKPQVCDSCMWRKGTISSPLCQRQIRVGFKFRAQRSCSLQFDLPWNVVCSTQPTRVLHFLAFHGRT